MRSSNNRKSKIIKRKKEIRRRKIISLSFITILIVSIPLFLILNKKGSDNEIVKAENKAAKPKASSSKNTDNSKDNNKAINSKDPSSNKKEEVKIHNSGYLSLKDDPNADDAKIVAKNTNDLLTGTKQYPVRTDGKKVVYLTFDDGPSTTNTPTVLKTLDKYNVKGTFFIMGKSLAANNTAKELLKEIAKNGHAIANHSYSHDYDYLYPGRTMNVSNMLKDFKKNDALMKSVLGKDFSTRVIRLPGGYWSWNGREPFKKKMIELNISNIDWNALNGDAEGKKKNAPELVNFLKKSVNELGPNADSVVVLMHDTYGKAETAKALPQIIEYFKDKGFEFRTIK